MEAQALLVQPRGEIQRRSQLLQRMSQPRGEIRRWSSLDRPRGEIQRRSQLQRMSQLQRGLHFQGLILLLQR